MAEVILEEVSKRFGDGTLAVDNVSLTIDDEEFFVFVGPSGCGKTTLLRMVAGLETVTSGSVRIGGTVVNNLEPGERDIAMVFQDYALYPHLTAYENLAFALKRRKLSRDEIESRVQSTAQMLGLSDLLGKKPGQLSGGQRQRIALGRAIVRNPQAFLMDEPLSNLDAKLRVQMRTELLKLHQGLPTTTVYVTHDQVEAMTMGHRVAVLRDGRIHQVDTPQRLYQSPRNVFVAGFIGSPAMNLCLGDVVSRDGELIVSFGRYSVPVTSERRSGLEVYAGKPVFVGVRPEAFEDAALLGSGSQDLPQIQAHVDIVEHLGAETLVTFRTGAPPLRGEEARAADVQETALVEQEKAEAAFVARLDPRTSARTGTFLNLAVDPARIYFFDPATGNAIASLGGE